MGKRLKATRFNIEGYDVQHYRATDTYTRAVTRLFDKATKDIAAEAVRAKIDPDKPFAFEDYPSANKSLKRIINKLAKGMEATISQGSRRQWLFANKKNDKFIDSIMDTSKLSKARLKKMQDANLDALKAFQGRKVQGLDLSQRVWKYMDQYKEQLEAAIDVGLGEGKSAQQLARDVKQNLVYPDKLFRRVRDKRGMLQLSKAAKAFHPGRGVYRSSVRNAQRLTRSEINMAYRESDYQRWQSLNFVVGFEIHRSNHEPLCDCKLCSRLTGRYPKWFKFVGWHPQCMCYATPILADEETIDENELGDLKAALKGTTYKAKQPKNVVLDVTDEFKAWVRENQDAQANWKSTPYFIRDNFKNGNLSEGLKRPVAYLPNENKNAAPSIDVQVREAIELAEKWGLFLQANMLRHIAAANDINGINERIKIINTKVNELRTLCEQTEREAEEWGLPTDTISKAIDTHNTNNIFRAVNNLKDDIKQINKEYKQYLSEAQQAIDDARGLKIDASGVVNDIAAVKANKRNYGKNSTEYRNRLRELLNKLHKSKEPGEPTQLEEVFDNIEKFGVEYREVKMHETQPTENEIISRVGGGDKTKGSCASLAFAWVANKSKMDVLDFRDGTSRQYFSQLINLEQICSKVGGYSTLSTTGIEMMKRTEIGKQYYLAIGRHAAIVRQTSKGKYEYLELQSQYDNGWHPLDSKVFGWRFSARRRGYGLLIDIELLQKDAGFKKMVGYINTNQSEQVKGNGGTIR